MSQERMLNNDLPVTTVAQGYKPPSIERSLSRASEALNKIRVIHGANEQYFDNLQGKNVGAVRKSLRDVFNIPGDAVALVSGKEVGDDFILEGNVQLEFTKTAGVKGGTL